MRLLPPELYLKIIEEVAEYPHPDPYQIDSVSTLTNLSLVNHDFHRWCSPILYARVSLACNRVPLFCRTVVQDWELDLWTEPPVISTLTSFAHRVKSLALRRGGSATVPGDEIEAILTVMSTTLERLFLNAAELIAPTSDLSYQTLVGAIHRLQNLKEFCGFLVNPTNIILPCGSKSTLRKLVLFYQELPLRLPAAITSFTHLKNLALIYPVYDSYPIIPDSEHHVDLFDTIRQLANLEEVTIFTDEWLSTTLWPNVTSQSRKPAEGASEAERRYRSIMERNLRFVALEEWPGFDLKEHFSMETVLQGELWDLERMSDSAYVTLFMPKGLVYYTFQGRQIGFLQEPMCSQP